MSIMPAEAGELSADPSIIEAWVKGWKISRETQPPVPVLGGLRVDVGQAQQRVRYVFTKLDPLALQPVSEPASATAAPWM